MKRQKQVLILLFFTLIFSSRAQAEISADAFFDLIDANDVQAITNEVANGFEINRSYVVKGFPNTPLSYAVRMFKPEIVEFLLQSGAQVDLVATKGDFSPLMLAIMFDSADIRDRPDLKNWKEGGRTTINLLLEYGANVNFMAVTKETPLRSALFGMDFDRSLEIVRQLISAGADVNLYAENEIPPIFIALLETRMLNNTLPLDDPRLARSRAPFVKMLLDAGANPNSRFRGKTPLHADTLDVESAKLLLEAGADAAAKDDEGRTPLDIAEQRKDRQLADLLKKHVK